MIKRFLDRWLRRARPEDMDYAAVTVTSPAKCCEAALATLDQPLLLTSHPQLPLPDCSMPDACRCQFRNWDDRRIGERRLPGASLSETAQFRARIRNDRRG